MSGFGNLNNIFFGNLAVNNIFNMPKKELNTRITLDKPIADTVSFKKDPIIIQKKKDVALSEINNRHENQYLSFGVGKMTKKRMQAIREAAIKLRLRCIYTGKIFGIEVEPTIEHFLPYSEKSNAEKFGLKHINVIGNWGLAGQIINGKRNSIPLQNWFEQHPEYLENAKNVLPEYNKINIPELGILGSEYVRRAKRTLNNQLGYIAFTGRKSTN